MSRHELQDFDVNSITDINPKYDLNNTAGGYFVIVCDGLGDFSFNIQMSSVINYKLEREDAEGSSNLFDFISSRFKDLTLSHAVMDLYDLGFPVDEWVVDYISWLNGQRKNYSAMLSLLAALQSFGDDEETL